MTRLNLAVLLSTFFSSSLLLHAQTKKELTNEDKKALEGVIVETYYISDSTDYADTLGGILTKGSITYRIYIDLKKGYYLQGVYGVTGHPLRLTTTTTFFNSNNGVMTGDKIDVKKINTGKLALDSWVTIGSATRMHFGILKTEDKDSSVITRKLLNKTDGLTKTYITHGVVNFGTDLTFLQDTAHSTMFYTEDGSWALLGGIKGPTDENKILIAQLTTNGKLSFELNIQVGTPTGNYIRFVAKNPEEDEIQFKGLTY